jgi:hypothetical protein
MLFMYFTYSLRQVIQSYQAESDVELDLSIGDILVVRKVMLCLFTDI